MSSSPVAGALEAARALQRPAARPSASGPDRRARSRSPAASMRAGRRAACRHISAPSALVAGCRGRRVLAQQRGQAHRLVAQLDAHRRLGGRAVIALVEQQVQRALHRRRAASRTPRRRGRTACCGSGERLFAARDALLDRRAPGQKRARDLGGAEAAQDIQDQRELRLLRQAAGGSTKTSSAAARRGSCARRNASSISGASVHSVSSSRPSSGANCAPCARARTTSSARFLAVAISHADGFSGHAAAPSTPRARGRTRPGRRLRRAPGCERRRSASARRPCAPDSRRKK